MSKTKKTTKIYELAFLISPNHAPEEAVSFYEKINSFLQESGALLIDFFSPQKVLLAYEIKKQKEAYLASTTFQIKVDKINQIKEAIANFEKENKILRSLIFTKKVKK